jgi:transcriptional regulator with XRE-family HTH domain
MNRIKQLRLARGWSQDNVVEKIDQFVSKSALSKYETGQDVPSPKVVQKLARLFGVSMGELLQPMRIVVDFAGYLQAGLSATQREQVEWNIRLTAERRYAMAELLDKPAMPFKLGAADVRTGEEAEAAAEHLRKSWRLGDDPVVKPVACLESQGVIVIEHNGPSEFTGLCGLVKDAADKPRAWTVVIRTDQCGGRQGLTAIHEVCHGFCKVPVDMIDKDVEKLMNRFAGAFHAPADQVRKAFGPSRVSVGFDELIIQKQRFRLSIGALLYRLRDCGILSPTTVGKMFGTMKKKGWLKQEPGPPIEPEQVTWHKAAARRLWSEGALSWFDAKRIIGEEPGPMPEGLKKAQAFLKLPQVERDRQLEKAAKDSARYYENEIRSGAFDVEE